MRFFPISSLLALVLLLGFSKSASAQAMYGYGYGYGIYYTRTFAPVHPSAQHDPRIHSSLVRASQIADHRAEPHSLLRCWRYVKTALLEAGAVSAYPSTAYAKEAGSELVGRYGFVRLPIRDPYHAPVGSVIVYGGRGAGHVELRTEHGFVSDYRSHWACRFPLIGVYAKLAS